MPQGKQSYKLWYVMMEKLLDYKSVTETHKFQYNIRPAGGSLVKQASASEWPPEILDFINNLVPDEKMHYALCNALGAGEYWSSNINGDFFEEEELEANHSTFLNGTPFLHHVNKDPSKGYGKILFSTYNPRMHRVELIVAYDTTKLPKKIVRKLENEEPLHLSMGCRVAYDVCSICGNKAYTPKEYCVHVTEHGLNHVYPNGKKVYLLNPDPDFFDLSIVIIPADRTACVLAKIFGAKIVDKIQDNSLKGFASLAKASSIKAENLRRKVASINLIDYIPTKSYSALLKIATATKSPKGLFNSMKFSNSYFKPNEVQSMLFMQKGMHKLAKVLLEDNCYFEFPDTVLTELPGNTKLIKIGSEYTAPFRMMEAMGAINLAGAADVYNPSTIINGNELASLTNLITPELLTEIGNASMISALIGSMLFGSSLTLPAIIGIGAKTVANALKNQETTQQEMLRQMELSRDLYTRPLIQSKKASKNLTLRDIYSIPLYR